MDPRQQKRTRGDPQEVIPSLHEEIPELEQVPADEAGACLLYEGEGNGPRLARRALSALEEPCAAKTKYCKLRPQEGRPRHGDGGAVNAPSAHKPKWRGTSLCSRPRDGPYAVVVTHCPRDQETTSLMKKLPAQTTADTYIDGPKVVVEETLSTHLPPRWAILPTSWWAEEVSECEVDFAVECDLDLEFTAGPETRVKCCNW